MRLNRNLGVLAATLIMTGVVGAQTGSDSCTTPDPITGSGTFPMDNTLASPDGPGTCINLGQNLDIWFEWTASFTGLCEVSTCGQASWDTKLAAYTVTTPGACPLATDELACNDDTCGLQSTISFSSTAGTAYLIRVAGFATAAGTGTFSILNLTPPCVEDGLEENDSCATATTMLAGGQFNLACYGDAVLRDDDWYSTTVAPSDALLLDLTFIHASGDIDVELYDGCGGTLLDSGTTTTDNESVSWTNGTGSPATVYWKVFGDAAQDCNLYNMNVVLAPPGPCTFPDDSYEDNDDCATAVPMPDGSYTGLWTEDPDEDFYSTTVPDGNTLTCTIYFSDAIADVDLALYDAASCPGGALAGSYSVSDDESFTWTNTTGADLDVIIRVYMFSAGSDPCIIYDMDLAGGTPGTLGTPFCLGDGSDGGTCPCGNPALVGSGEGCLNGTGLGAFIAASGSASVSADTLVLTVNQAVPSDFGIFVQNIGIRVTPAPFYNGLFCLNADSHLVRHYGPPVVQPTVTDPTGTGVNAQPMTIGDYLGDTQPGVTMYYQFWGRDNAGPCGAGANFSSGLFLTWLP